MWNVACRFFYFIDIIQHCMPLKYWINHDSICNSAIVDCLVSPVSGACFYPILEFRVYFFYPHSITHNKRVDRIGWSVKKCEIMLSTRYKYFCFKRFIAERARFWPHKYLMQWGNKSKKFLPIINKRKCSIFWLIKYNNVCSRWGKSIHWLYFSSLVVITVRTTWEQNGQCMFYLCTFLTLASWKYYSLLNANV